MDNLLKKIGIQESRKQKIQEFKEQISLREKGGDRTKVVARIGHIVRGKPEPAVVEEEEERRLREDAIGIR